MVLANVDCGAIVATRTCITGLDEPAFTGQDRSGDDLVTFGVLWRYNLRSRPGLPVVRAGPLHHD